jgi:type II secretory pathway pseudopilin PulG
MKPVVIGIIIVIVLIVIVSIAFAVSTSSAADADVAAAKAAAEKSAAEKAAINTVQTSAPVESTGGSVSSEPVEKPVEKPADNMPSLSDYKFYPGKDSGGNDIGNFPGTPTQIASTCNSKPKCKGFNSNGWVKHTISDPSSFQTWTSDPSLGFYVKP